MSNDEEDDDDQDDDPKEVLLTAYLETLENSNFVRHTHTQTAT